MLEALDIAGKVISMDALHGQRDTGEKIHAAGGYYLQVIKGQPAVPGGGLGWPTAEQVFRIRRDSGPARGSWEHREFALGITNLPSDLAGRGRSPPAPAGTN